MAIASENCGYAQAEPVNTFANTMSTVLGSIGTAYEFLVIRELKDVIFKKRRMAV